jgi:hypothetical protein
MPRLLGLLTLGYGAYTAAPVPWSTPPNWSRGTSH